MKNNKSLLFSVLFGLSVFISVNAQNRFDMQAHRGGAGLLPENTIISEKNAIDYNNTMEMDLQMTKDKKIVVSHMHYLDHSFVLTPDSQEMTEKDGKSRLIYDMPYDSLIQYDVGLKPNPHFTAQKNVKARIPLFSVLIDSVEAYAKRNGKMGYYNIELKTGEERDGISYSNINEYIDLAMGIIIKKDIQSRIMIQSFDTRALNIVRKKWPNIQLSYLVWGGEKESARDYIDELGFIPAVFSPNYKTSTRERIEDFHRMGVKVIPWTPNTVDDIQRLRDMGVDGVITDYPDLFSKLKLN